MERNDGDKGRRIGCEWRVGEEREREEREVKREKVKEREGERDKRPEKNHKN